MIRIEGWPKLRTLILIAYSAAIMATILPGFNRVPTTLILPYFAIFPGYAFSLVLRQTEGVFEMLFYSLVWSVAILVSIFSLATVAPSLSTISLNAVIPVITMIFTVYSYYHGR